MQAVHGDTRSDAGMRRIVMNPQVKTESGPGDPREEEFEARADPAGGPPGEPGGHDPAKVAPVHFVLIALGTIAFLYVGRPVVLPLFLAWMAATTLRPLVRWLSGLHLPTAFSAAVVFCLLVGAITAGFLELERPATRWINELEPLKAGGRQG